MSQEITITPGKDNTEISAEAEVADPNEGFLEALDGLITPEREAKKYSELLDAKRAVIVKEKHRDYDAKTLDEKEEVIYVPHVEGQLAALKLLGQARQRFDKKQKTKRMGIFMGKVFITVEKSDRPRHQEGVIDIAPSNLIEQTAGVSSSKSPSAPADIDDSPATSSSGKQPAEAHTD